MWVITPLLQKRRAIWSETWPTYGMTTLPLMSNPDDTGSEEHVLGQDPLATFQGFLVYPETLSTSFKFCVSWVRDSLSLQMVAHRWANVLMTPSLCCSGWLLQNWSKLLGFWLMGEGLGFESSLEHIDLYSCLPICCLGQLCHWHLCRKKVLKQIIPVPIPTIMTIVPDSNPWTCGG